MAIPNPPPLGHPSALKLGWFDLPLAKKAWNWVPVAQVCWTRRPHTSQIKMESFVSDSGSQGPARQRLPEALSPA